MNVSKYLDRALTRFNLTFIDIPKSEYVNTGRMKGKKEEVVHWTNLYAFRNEEEYEDWKHYCLKTLTLGQFQLLDMVQGPDQPYLFKEILST